MFKKLIKFLLSPFLGKKQFQGFFSWLFLLSLKGMNFGGGSSWAESGEEWVIKHFAKSSKTKNRPAVFFDVGANVGGYALAAAKTMEKEKIDYEIFCFEPAQKTFGLLKGNVSANANIKPFNTALGNTEGKSGLYSDGLESGLASLYRRDAEVVGKQMDVVEEVFVETLDGFCEKHAIGNIDFLKLDVEGNEYNVLLGAKKFIDGGKILFIQFEFGGTDIDARVYFLDFYKLLSGRYNIYRILKNGIHPIPVYKETDEIFFTTNYLAILK
jgi:FkbM family methyltransferase